MHYQEHEDNQSLLQGLKKASSQIFGLIIRQLKKGPGETGSGVEGTDPHHLCLAVMYGVKCEDPLPLRQPGCHSMHAHTPGQAETILRHFLKGNQSFEISAPSPRVLMLYCLGGTLALDGPMMFTCWICQEW